MISQSQIEFLQAFAELNQVSRRDVTQRSKLARYRKNAQAMLKVDAVCGYTYLGLLSCLERDLEAMHAFHKRAIELEESCFTLIYYAVSLEKSCLWNESVRFGLLALDYDPANLKILEAILKLVPLAGRFALYKRLLPLWQEANNGVQHNCQRHHEIVTDLLARHGVPEKDLKQLITAIGDALSETNVAPLNFRYEIVTHRGTAPFIHFRFAIADDLVASYYEDVVEAKLAQLLYHPRLTDAFSFSMENAAVHQFYEGLERELSDSPDDIRLPDPEKLKLIEELIAVRGGAATGNELQIRFHAAFDLVLDELVSVVAKERKRDPENYRKSPQTRLLARIYRTIKQEIPVDPQHASYHLANGEGGGYSQWKRAKLGDKYRMFFKYLKEDNTVILAWIISEMSASTYKSHMDAYRAYRQLQRLANG